MATPDQDPDEGDDRTGRERTRLGHRPSRLPRTIAVAAVLGALGGVVTVAFVRLMDGIKDLLWTRLPDGLGIDGTEWWFIIPLVLVGAVLLGVARHHLGEYPLSIEASMEQHAREGEFDYHHLWQALVISLISLGFGAALGPEAALMAILGGVGSWIARVIDANTAEGDDLSFVGISGALGALFGTAGAAVLVLDPRSTDAADARSGRLWRVIPGIVSAVAGLYIYELLGSADHYFDLGLPDYSFSASELAWSVPVALASTALGLLFLACGRGTDRLLRPIVERPVLVSVVGGLGLGVLASFSTLVLFSGHEGVDTLITDYGDDSVRTLLLLALAKLVVAALLLSARWKGGRFFPLMFVGAAVGLAMSQLLGSIGEVPALAAGMTAVVGVLMKRPLLAGGFMILFFPPAAWPVVIVATLIGCQAGQRLTDVIVPPAPDPADPAGPADPVGPVDPGGGRRPAT